MISRWSIVFFFQAEDGIRDLTVTGVQTCALPIYLDALGAGDQGMMFGYACRETDALMPMPIHLAHRLAERLAGVRKSGDVPYLRPDGKTQVTVEYEGNRPVRVSRVLISTQHQPDIDTATLLTPDLVEHVITPTIPAELEWSADEVLVNPS